MEVVMLRLLMCVLGIVLSASCFSLDLYRYQDGRGQWIFGDKKSLSRPSLATQPSIEKIVIEDTRIKIAKPSFKYIKEITDEGRITTWELLNPLPVSIQHSLALKGSAVALTSILAKPFETVMLSPENYGLADNVNIDHYYLLGEPVDKPSNLQIPPPYRKTKQFLISQGFNGQFSHNHRGSRYAIDIAMPIGENVLAVKRGIVADARDDFSIGGAANYFLDKANHVTIMHDDGSYAIYAHVLHGSLAVFVGQRVEMGRVLARVGNTGYSTGPHLHFVMRYNSGQGVSSLPFKFITDEGPKVPRMGQYYSGQLKQRKNSKD